MMYCSHGINNNILTSKNCGSIFVLPRSGLLINSGRGTYGSGEGFSSGDSLTTWSWPSIGRTYAVGFWVMTILGCLDDRSEGKVWEGSAVPLLAWGIDPSLGDCFRLKQSDSEGWSVDAWSWCLSKESLVSVTSWSLERRKPGGLASGDWEDISWGRLTRSLKSEWASLFFCWCAEWLSWLPWLWFKDAFGKVDECPWWSGEEEAEDILMGWEEQLLLRGVFWFWVDV